MPRKSIIQEAVDEANKYKPIKIAKKIKKGSTFGQEQVGTIHKTMSDPKRPMDIFNQKMSVQDLQANPRVGYGKIKPSATFDSNSVVRSSTERITGIKRGAGYTSERITKRYKSDIKPNRLSTVHLGYSPNKTPLPKSVKPSLISKIAKSKLPSAIARTPLIRAAGMAGMAYGAVTDLGQIARASVEVGRAVRHKPVKAIPREQSASGKATPIKVAKQKMYPMTPVKKQKMYPMTVVDKNPYVSGTPILKKNTVAITGANASKKSKGGSTPKPLRQAFPENKSDLSFLKIKLRQAKPRPMPRKEIYLP